MLLKAGIKMYNHHKKFFITSYRLSDTMNRQDFNYLSSSTHNNNNNNNIQKGSLITRSFPLALLLLLVGGGAIASIITRSNRVGAANF